MLPKRSLHQSHARPFFVNGERSWKNIAVLSPSLLSALNGSAPGRNRRLVRQAKAGSRKQAIFIEGYSTAIPITDVTIAHCEFPVAPSPNLITNALRIELMDNYGPGVK